MTKRTHFSPSAVPSGLRQEEKRADEEESGRCCGHVVDPSPVKVDDDIRRRDTQGDDDDTLSGEDTGNPGESRSVLSMSATGGEKDLPGVTLVDKHHVLDNERDQGLQRARSDGLDSSGTDVGS